MEAYVRAVSRVEGSVAHAVGSLARASASRPRVTIGLFVMLSLALTAGLVTVNVESRSQDLWTDEDSETALDLAFVEANFERQERFELIPFSPKAGGNAVKLAMMQDAFALHAIILALTTKAGSSYADLCARDFAGDCRIGGPLRFWNVDEATFVAQEANDTSVGTTCLQLTYPDFSAVQRDTDFGQFLDVGGLATAVGFVMSYPLLPEFDGGDEEQLEFEELLIDAVLGAPLATASVSINSERSLDDELARSVGSDILLLVIAYTLMISFVSLTLGRSCDKLRGRGLLATCDIFVILMSTGASYGFASLIGVPFTSLAQILPFILVGIGADNAFVIVAAFDRTDHRNAIEQRIFDAMTSAGVSVTVTSLTDFAAFMLTSLGSLPALVWFGQYAGIAILFIFIAHLTVFPAMLTLDEYRIQAHRRNCVPCVKVKETTAAVVDDNLDVKLGAHQHDSALSRFFRDRYAPVLLRPAVKAFVLFVFCVLTGVATWQATDLSTDFDLRILAPDDSYLQDAYDDFELFFGAIDYSVEVGLFFKELNYGDAAIQVEMRRLADLVLVADAIDTSKGSLDWHAAFVPWVQLQPAFNSSLDGTGTFLEGSPEFFASAVQAFLLEPAFGPFAAAIVFSSSGAGDVIVASTIRFFLVITASSSEDVDALEEMEAIAATSFLGDDVAINAFRFIFFDQYRIIVGQTLTTVALAVVAVTVIASVLLVHPIAVAISATALIMTFACLLGSLPLFGLPLNSLSAINLVMSIGILVDFQVHFLHMAGSIDPLEFSTRNERVTEALHRIGPAVLLGIGTTFLGVLPLAAAGSEVFRTFFKVFLAIVVLGGSFGLIFVPVVYSLVGPAINRATPRNDKSPENIPH